MALFERHEPLIDSRNDGGKFTQYLGRQLDQ